MFVCMYNTNSNVDNVEFKYGGGILLSLFFFIFILNFFVFNIFPHIHANYWALTAFMFYLVVESQQLYRNFILNLSRFSPSGIRGLGAVFICVLEIFSSWLRILTMSFRIYFNYLAGHFVLFAVCGASVITLSLIPLALFGILFELAVLLIQSVIFTSLVYMFFSYSDH
uniref:ATP synthase F0 subunit 6 n=1 Tax=Miroplana shenzhensis TaxID=2597322 RepID=UPI001FAEB854|nr:ATP synthase F0 subunit 6 [Miroplana shenzhensis]UJT52295.1 ATP synthase F0 subunit 6 [Miroplana shenzhensis]